MSRCFPFPPPGYERRSRTDNVDLLAKEKQKEKKHKKEKKDKEKREGKDNKEKDRSKDRHKDKKDRKEKHKDHKKDKDKNPSEGDRADKQNEPNHNGLGECSQKSKETSHSKFTEDLDRRIKEEQKDAASRMVENFNIPSHKIIGNTASPNSLVGRVAGDRVSKSTVDSQGRNERMEKAAGNIPNSALRTDVQSFTNVMQKEKITSQKEASKFEKGDILPSGNGMQRDHFGGPRLAPKIEQKGATGTEPALLNPKVSIRKLEGDVAALKEKENKKSDINSNSFIRKAINGMSQPTQALSNVPRQNISLVPFSTKEEKKDDEKYQNHVRGIDGMSPFSEKAGLTMIGGTDNKEDKGRKEGKQKDRDHKKHKRKHKHKDKEKDKEKKKEKSERKKKKHGELGNKEKKDQIDGPKLKILDMQVGDTKNQLSNDKVKKRKEIEANGFIHENDSRLNKTLKTTPSSHHPVENGRRFQVSPDTTGRLVIKPEVTNNAIAKKLSIDNKNHTMNGISESQSLSTHLRTPDMAGISVPDKVSLKPHPDQKYLSQIYSVPKMEWQEYDDQEWLFCTNRSQQEQQLPRKAVKPPQVWAEALRFESDDIIAMPYVLPL